MAQASPCLAGNAGTDDKYQTQLLHGCKQAIPTAEDVAIPACAVQTWVTTCFALAQNFQSQVCNPRSSEHISTKPGNTSGT